ncbi:uncharacterized protein EKO05_0002693 [Ascochyta rabiei]|uniref:uncharacterized protein n=1 Tax=Didymella rabiei TaxID=5454 RepID=UPI0022084317|nr:uncharacterized protein EKO05_0002693 [Ascochyta rabiei]UPX12124.1 hypothetical protein EKO05_0002693 [Ascochyta rabiei]
MDYHLGGVSDGQNTSSKRLPVNPRRHKVAPDQRKRVVRACNACNNRRVKCSGGQPCQRCIQTSRDCEYTASDTDRTSLKDEMKRLQARCSVLEEGLATIAPHQAPDLLSQLDRGEPPDWASVVPYPVWTLNVDEDDETGGRLLNDPFGTVRYLGGSSGATFLDQLKQVMVALLVPLTPTLDSEDGSAFVASVGHYQTFDSRPLPNPDVDPTWLPSRSDMALMLQDLRQHIQDGNGAFASGGIYWWGDLISIPTSPAGSTSMAALTTTESHRHLAFHHVCFALSVSIVHTSVRRADNQSGEAYFKRARLLLGNPLDNVRFSFSDVPALALMGFYLIEVNRRDAAYMRTLWTLYIMDRWISMLMGRPPVIPDDAIRLPLPVDAPSMPPSAGLCAHVELARISGYIVCETCGIAPRIPRAAGSAASIDRALRMLRDWYAQLPVVLQIAAEQPLLDPACCTLHMHYNQLVILATRPMLFAAIKKVVALQASNGLGSSEEHLHGSHTRSCIEAAHRNLHLARLLGSTNRHWFQSGLHFLFNAAVVLLLSRISSACEEDVDSDRATEGRLASEISFAIQVFEQEAKVGTNYPRDCWRVLRDLKALTDRYVFGQHTPISQHVAVRNLTHPHPSQPKSPTPTLKQ